jgi:tetratricopeptide (TPR) repeat protein
VRGQLQLYTLAYEGKLTEDASEQKRQQLEMWRLYQNTVDKLLLSNATQPALQASHETEQLAQHFNQQFPNDAEYAALKKHGDCQQQKIQQLLKPESPALSADCEIILNHVISAAQFNDWGVSLYKQKQYPQAQAIFAKGLEKFPEYLDMLSNDAELALVQGDKQRLQQRLNTLQTLYKQKDGVYTNQHPAIMQFLQYVSDAEQTPEALLNVITQTDKAVFYNWDFSDIQPVLKALSPARQKTATLFIDFFQSRINLDSLKSQLKGGK